MNIKSKFNSFLNRRTIKDALSEPATAEVMPEAPQRKAWMARQGDILIRLIDEIPTSAVQEAPEDKRLVLAAGEATGHHHAIMERPTVKMFSDGGEAKYIEIEESPAALVHEEHAAISIPPGKYAVLRQREYEPRVFSRQVGD